MPSVCAVLLISLMLLLSACTSTAERDARQRWYDSLTTEQQVRLEERRILAIGMILGGGGFQSWYSTPEPYRSIPLPAPRPIVRQ